MKLLHFSAVDVVKFWLERLQLSSVFTGLPTIDNGKGPERPREQATLSRARQANSKERPATAWEGHVSD